jgi:radical SAM protein with 4Fe4S-binding SPASM domain
MQPKTTAGWDVKTFGRLRDRMRSRVSVARAIETNPGYATDLPEEVGLQLTYRCNLRCEHCFQWNDTGFHHAIPIVNQREDLPLEIVARILEETRPAKSKLYLWGGEPLVYRHWEGLMKLLVADPRWTVLCTNGIGFERRLETLLPISSSLVALISIDGFQDENDAVRGKGTFKKIINGIRLLLDLKTRGDYRGEVSVSCVINAALVPRLFEFVEFFEALDVNSVYLVFPWYIPERSAVRMDDFFAQHLGWLRELAPQGPCGSTASWHSYTYRLPMELVPSLQTQMERINAKAWRIRVRFQPALEPSEVADFVAGSERPAQGRKRCLSVSTRLSVLPDGTMTTCKLFPEMRVADLNSQTIRSAWHSSTAQQTREVLARGLTPVCSKCVQLYLHGT